MIQNYKLYATKNNDNQTASLPSKAYANDAGFDLTIIEKIDKTKIGYDLDSEVEAYTTGIKLILPDDCYAEVHARSSLPRYGFRLANGVGIIDNGFHGEIIVLLQKFNSNIPDPVLPFRCAQLIVKQQIPVILEEISKTQFDDLTFKSKRNQNGFGSSG